MTEIGKDCLIKSKEGRSLSEFYGIHTFWQGVPYYLNR